MNKINAIVGFVFAAFFLIAGIIAYSTGYIITIARIPLSGTAFIIIAVLVLAYAIFALVRAPKKDKENEQQYQAEVKSIAQQQDASGNVAQNRTTLAAPCTIVIAHTKGALGLVNKLSVVINGQPAGEIKQKGSLHIQTPFAENTVTIIQSNTRATATINVIAGANGTINLKIKAGIGLTIEQA